MPRLDASSSRVVQLTPIVQTTHPLFAVRQKFYHPFHLHGHRFIVTDSGSFPSDILTDQIAYLRNLRTVRRPNAHCPPYKDTQSIPNRGYVRIRFRADNPGKWGSRPGG